MDSSNCSISRKQILFYVDYSWWLSGIGTLSIASLGIIFNSMVIYVLCDKRMISSFFNRLLVFLAIVDNLFLANSICVAVMEQLSGAGSAFANTIFVHLLYPTRNMLMCASIYMTIGLACERFNSTSNPYLHRARQHMNACYRLSVYILPVISFSMVYNIPKFFDLKVISIDSDCTNTTVIENGTFVSHCNSTEYHRVPTQMRKNDHYILWYINISNLVVTAIIPLLLLSYFNLNIYRSLKERQVRKSVMVSQQNSNVVKDRNKKEVRQTFVLFAIVVLFLICHALRVILNVEEFVNLGKQKEEVAQGCTGEEFWTLIAIPVASLLIQVNSGTNFFIYCVLSDQFREVLRSKFKTQGSLDQNGESNQTKRLHFPTKIVEDNIELKELT